MTRVMGYSAVRCVRLVLVATLVAGWFVMTGPPARACSCGGTPRDNLPYAEGAFVGELTGKDVTGSNSVEWTFEVELVAKGEFGPTAIVRSPEQESACGLSLRTGERVGLLLQRGDDGIWYSSLCAQYGPSEVLSAVSRPHPPDPGVEPIGRGALPWWGFAILGGLAIVGIFLLATKSRRTGA